MSKSKAAVEILLACGGCVAYLFSAISLPAVPHRILIPADRPFAVTEPMRVDVLSADGTKGVRIPANSGRGWCGEAGGSASYVFRVPADGAYTLWGHCRWADACSNAVFVQVDASPKVLLGNNPSYDAWHWVRGTEWVLSRGTHQLRLSNHSDNIQISELMLLSDPFDSPAGRKPAFYDLFYDGFDGCDGGNVDSWNLDPEEWQLVQTVARQDFAHRALAGCSSRNKPPIVAGVGHDSWQGYSLALRVRFMSAGRFLLGANCKRGTEAVLLELSIPENSKTAATVGLVDSAEGNKGGPDPMHISLVPERWYELAMSADGAVMRFTVDGASLLEFESPKRMTGPVCLIAADGACVWVDDVHVQVSRMSDR